MNISEERVETRFLANMSHEIRTPMNSIMGFLGLVLEDQNLSPNHRSNLETALHSARHLLNLIDNILDISRLESRGVVVSSRQFDLSVLLSTVQGKWSTVAHKKGLHFTIDVDPTVRGFYFGDAVIIEKVLDLLLDNAVKFTEHGTVSVQVKAGTGQGMTLFEIHDTGIGIHPTFINEIFQPFMQGDSTNSRSYEGVGLGATIALRFAQLLDGTLKVESQYGSGTTFLFQIPLELCPDTYPASLPEMAPAIITGERRFKILLVDDVETNLELARVHLRRRGQDVDTAANGLEAVDCAEETQYDVVLMDIHMPIMDGIEAMKQIRASEGDTRHTMIIALTADQMSEVRLPLIERGFDDVVGKPVNFEELMRLLQETLPAHLGVPLEKKESLKTIVQAERSNRSEKDLAVVIEETKVLLELYNPQKVMPALEDLRSILGENRYLSTIFGLVDTYEFDKALVELERLVHSLESSAE